MSTFFRFLKLFFSLYLFLFSRSVPFRQLFNLHETALETLSNNADAVAEKNALNWLSHQATTLGRSPFRVLPRPTGVGGGGG